MAGRNVGDNPNTFGYQPVRYYSVVLDHQMVSGVRLEGE